MALYISKVSVPRDGACCLHDIEIAQKIQF